MRIQQSKNGTPSETSENDADSEPAVHQEEQPVRIPTQPSFNASIQKKVYHSARNKENQG